MNKTDRNVCFHSPYILEGSKDNTETKKRKKKSKPSVIQGRGQPLRTNPAFYLFWK